QGPPRQVVRIDHEVVHALAVRVDDAADVSTLHEVNPPKRTELTQPQTRASSNGARRTPGPGPTGDRWPWRSVSPCRGSSCGCWSVDRWAPPWPSPWLPGRHWPSRD